VENRSAHRPALAGVLVIDKPSGPTSFDVVRRVRGLLRVKKVGHTGTLDPTATGVLPVCVGEATKIAGFILEGDKAYDAVIRLGEETDTLDAAGKIVRELPVPELTAEKVEAALARFRGTFDQVPPMYSAIKVEGKRLYELARAGETIERRPRQVTVHALVLRDLSAREITVSVRCSKGFFVRSLAQELGEALGTVAHLKALRRTHSGPFQLGQAMPLEQLEKLAPNEREAAVRARLVPMVDALAELPSLRVNEAEARKVAHGVPLEVPAKVTGRVRVISAADERLLAVADVQAGGRLKYARVLVER
jgi:tRNA pseudouridine55 synthase